MSTTNRFFYTAVQSSWRFVWIPSLYLVAPVFLTGCGSIKIEGLSESNYSQVARAYIRPVCSSRVVVVTPEKQDAFVYAAPPTTTIGCTYRIEAPLGKMIRNRTEDVFGRVFSAKPNQNQSGVFGEEYVVTPVYKKLTYGLGTADMTMVLDMEVIVKKADGTMLYREQFHETDRVSLTTAGKDSVTYGIDKLVFNIMLKAANNTVVKIASTETASTAK